jgi:hypothetical protein
MVKKLMPELKTPNITASNITASNINAPNIKNPNINAPYVIAPYVNAPYVNAPYPGGKSTRRKLIPKKRHQSHIKKQLPKRKTRKNQLSTQYKRHGKRTSKNGFHHERSE